MALLLPAIFGFKRSKGCQVMFGDATAMTLGPLQIGFMKRHHALIILFLSNMSSEPEISLPQ